MSTTVTALRKSDKLLPPFVQDVRLSDRHRQTAKMAPKRGGTPEIEGHQPAAKKQQLAAKEPQRVAIAEQLAVSEVNHSPGATKAKKKKRTTILNLPREIYTKIMHQLSNLVDRRSFAIGFEPLFLLGDLIWGDIFVQAEGLVRNTRFSQQVLNHGYKKRAKIAAVAQSPSEKSLQAIYDHPRLDFHPVTKPFNPNKLSWTARMQDFSYHMDKYEPGLILRGIRGQEIWEARQQLFKQCKTEAYLQDRRAFSFEKAKEIVLSLNFQDHRYGYCGGCGHKFNQDYTQFYTRRSTWCFNCFPMLLRDNICKWALDLRITSTMLTSRSKWRAHCAFQTNTCVISRHG